MVRYIQTERKRERGTYRPNDRDGLNEGQRERLKIEKQRERERGRRIDMLRERERW